MGFCGMCFFVAVYGATLGFRVGFSKEVPRLGMHTRASEVGIRYVKYSKRD